VHTMQQMIFYA